MKQNILDKVFRKYKKSVNMSYSELYIWNKNPLSKLASLNRKPIIRNLRLLNKNKNKWTNNDIIDANKTISYLARAKKIPKGKVIAKGMTRNDIALMNWAFNPYK